MGPSDKGESRYKDAVAPFEKAVELALNEAGPHYALAAAYANFGRYQESSGTIDDFASPEAPTQAAVYELAVTQLYLNDNQAAVESLNRAMSLPSPRSTPGYELLMYRGIAYDRLGMRDAAHRDYVMGRQKAIEDFARRPNNGPIESEIGYFDAALGDSAPEPNSNGGCGPGAFARRQHPVARGADV